MKRSLLLDPATGKPLDEAQRILHSHFEDYHVSVPGRVQESLDRASEDRGFMNSSVAWRDVLTPKDIIGVDSAAITNTTSETIMCPDFTVAGRALEVADIFKYTLLGKMSTVVTTPGTVTFRLRYGGVGGTSLAASGAFAPDPTGASTDVSYCVEWYVVCRAVGASGSMVTFGKVTWNDFDDASATTLKGNLDMQLAPVSGASAVSVDTTTAKALSPTVQFSVSTATTSLTNMVAILESLN